MNQPISTSVGVWRILKVRVDGNRELLDRFTSEDRGTGDHRRNVRFIGAALSSSNTIVVK